MAKAYEELVDFIAAGSRTEDVAQFQPSEEARMRVWELIGREKADGLNDEEKSELAYYLQLEHILRMAKARAKQVLRQNYQVSAIPEV